MKNIKKETVKTKLIILSGTIILLLNFLCNLTSAQEAEAVVGEIMSIDTADKTVYINFKEEYEPEVDETFVIYNEDKTILTKLMVSEVLGKGMAKTIALTEEVFEKVKLGGKVIKINHYELGMKYEKEGKHKEAIEEYRKVISSYLSEENVPKAHYRIGNIFQHNLNNIPEAIKAYQTVIAEYPDSEITNEARNELDNINKKEDSDKVAPRVRRKANSKNPRYAKVTLTGDGSKVLSIVFDESKGTGTGYDLIYAHANILIGNIEWSKTLKAKTKWGRYHTVGDKTDKYKGLYCLFPPINLNVYYAGEVKTISNPYSVIFEYSKYFSENAKEYFYATTNIKLKEGPVQWQYSFQSKINPSEFRENIPILQFNQNPRIAIEARLDERKKGYLKIVPRLRVGNNNWLKKCRRGATPVKVYIEIKKPDGRVVDKRSVSFDKFVFKSERAGFRYGNKEEEGYLIQVPRGDRTIEISIDTGPLVGLIKGSKKMSF